MAVIVAVAVNGDGGREVLGMDAGSEAETHRTDFPSKLARRDLRGVNPDQATEMPGGDRVEPVLLTCADGARLAGQLFGAQGAGAGAGAAIVIVLHGATGVPQTYYEAFAAWAVEEYGAAVLTYDYRDFATSEVLGESVRRSRATMATWGVIDQGTALDYACERFPDARVWVVGHSLGGMCTSFHAKANRIERLIAVASGPAHWLRHPLGFTPAVVAFWWLLGPLATAALGYLPGRLFGLGADLPRGVYWQWRRWCLSADFYRRDWGKTMTVPDLHRMQGALTLVGIADDKMIPPERVRALAAFYPAAKVTHRVIRPSDAGGRPIGHLRLFARRNAEAWPLLFSSC